MGAGKLKIKKMETNLFSIQRLDNRYHSETEPSIRCGENEYWFFRGSLHRGGGKPAVKAGLTWWWYWRGILVTREIANKELSAKQILEIDNMEQRQAAMEILGYEKFFSMARLFHRFTPDQFLERYPIESNPMYSLYLLKTGKDEKNDDIKILMMCDPSKFPVVKYFIRVHPDETDCRLAVAHSYKCDSWEKFIKNKVWV